MRWDFMDLYNEFNTLNNEEILVIDMVNTQGYIVNIKGINNNQKLMLLLADELNKYDQDMYQYEIDENVV